MRRTPALFASLLLGLIPVAANATEVRGLVLEEDLAGWTVEPATMASCWTVRDGVLHLESDPDQTGSILWTEQDFTDFEMNLEFRFGEGTVDSGVFIRDKREQIQIGQSGSLKRDMTASPYISGRGYPVEAERVADRLKPDGWNHLKIRAEGSVYTTWLNGMKVMTYDSDSAVERGRIGIQIHPKRDMSIDFRSIRITEILSSERTSVGMQNSHPGSSTGIRSRPPMKLSISPDHRHFVNQSGTPVFWLGDTAWNGALKATEEEWIRYLDARASQGFNVIQFVLNAWRGADQPRHGRIYDVVDGRVVENESALATMDAYIQAMVDRGIVPAPVMFWTNNNEPIHNPELPWMQNTMMNPYFSEAHMIEMGRMMLERWGHHQPIWMLAGDGEYRGREFAGMWKRIGRALFADHPEALVTIHPRGAAWDGDLFRDEPWYTIVGIQSGHGTAEFDLRLLTQGPYSYRWAEIKKPFINLEPNYEGAASYQTGVPHTAFTVRRAAYWSLLAAPVAGITYGTTGIWAWLRTEDEAAEGHGDGWKGSPWSEWLESEGIENMILMKTIFESLPWTELRPADYLMDFQPGLKNPEDFIKVAALPDESLIVAYKPTGDRVKLQLPHPDRITQAAWIDPRNGQSTPATPEPGDPLAFRSPDEQDWLLVLR